MTSRTSRMPRTIVVATVAVLATLALPLGAAAARSADDREVRVRTTCSAGSSAFLRLRADDGSIRLELRIEPRRRTVSPWSIIVVHERRIAFRGVLRATRSSGSLRLRRTLPDLFGRNTIVARASGAGREVCRIAAAL